MHTLELIFESYSTIKEESIYGRYITFEKIERLLPINNSEKIGFSELNKPIHKITFGQGSKKYSFGLKCMETKVQVQKLFSIS